MNLEILTPEGLRFLNDSLDLNLQIGKAKRPVARFDAGLACGELLCHAGVLRIVSTLLAKQGKPKELFDTAYANAQCLKIPAAEISLPSYWIRGGTGHRDTSKRSK